MNDRDTNPMELDLDRMEEGRGQGTLPPQANTSGRDPSHAASPQPDNAGTPRIEPLPGEAGIPHIARRQARPWSTKAIVTALAVTLTLAALVAAIVYLRRTNSGPAAPKPPAMDRQPVAAGASPKAPDLSRPPSAPEAITSGATDAAVAAARPQIEAAARRNAPYPPGQPTAVGANPAPHPSPPSGAPVHPETAPEDAPILLAGGPPSPHAPTVAPATNGDLGQTARRLEAYQAQLQGLMASLSPTTRTAPATSYTPPQPSPPHPGTSVLQAYRLGPRSLLLPKGSAFSCALTSRIISATSGLVGCLVQRDVYSEDGRVLLIERGAHLDGEYRVSSLQPGAVRIPVVWTRLRTPHGVAVDIASSGTGALGEAGIDGHVDQRWGERIGAALLLSVIDDAVQVAVSAQQRSHDGGTSVVFQGTTGQSAKLAEKILERTIHIPPLIYRNQGGVVGIVVAHDIDFSGVYALAPTALPPDAAPAPVADPEAPPQPSLPGPP